MSSHLSINKKFWAKDNGSNGVEIHDITKLYHEIIDRLPKMDNKHINEHLDKLDPQVVSKPQ